MEDALKFWAQVKFLFSGFVCYRTNLGGRDISDEVAGASMLQGIQRLVDDKDTKTIVLVFSFTYSLLYKNLFFFLSVFHSNQHL